MPSGRPKGSRSKVTTGYKSRTSKIKREYGKDIFKKWGKKGGNPILMKDKRKRNKKA
ncbi:MAG: hypothetical protein ABR924_16905 [Terracidiphilus sp.]|jgi:hypothetical protein